MSSRRGRCRDRDLARQVEQLRQAVKELERLVSLERDMNTAGKLLASALSASAPGARPDYWYGWADGWEAHRVGQNGTEGRFTPAVRTRRPALRVVPAPEDSA